VSLVEVMVAMGIFVLGSLSLLSVLTSGMSGTFDNRARVTAANLAAADIDEARSIDYYALSNGDVTKTVDGRDYRVVRTVSTTMSSGDTSSCVGSGSNKQRYKRVSTRVETAFRGRTRPVRADTLVKAPVFDPNSARGAIAFVVIDRNGNPLAGLPVNAASVDLTTDVRGCTFFDGLLPGTYVVTVTRAGSVRIDGSTTLSRSVTVTAGQISSEAMRIDVAANVTVRTDVYDGTTVKTGFELPTGLQARLAAPDRATATKYESAGKTVTAGADLTWTAYPSPGGYDAYVGPCSAVRHTDSEPGTSPPRIDLGLSPVTVQITGGTNDNLKGQSKTVSAAWLSSPSCSEPLSYAGKTSSICKVNSNGTDGCWLYIALRPGTWRLTLEGGTYFADVTVESRKALSAQINVSNSV
jgi:Tfp pilus assembly protein PilV